MAWLCFEDITRKEYGLLKTKRRDVGFRLFVLLLNVLATPVLLIVHFISIFVFPCIRDTFSSCVCRILFTRHGCLFCCKHMLYEDKDFPPNNKSLGSIKSSNSEIVWKRAQHVTYEYKNTAGKLNKLFDDGMDPDDICQGQLGDCWLLSALASLTVKPWTLENAFLTREWNPRGRYNIRLWDDAKHKFVTVTIDDYVPVNARSEKPVFSSPRGNEMWVMLMEKAFAKFMGSYSAIEGGYSLYAMNAITGGVVYKFNFDSSQKIWKRLEMRVAETKGGPDVRFYLASKHKKLSSDEMYELVARFHSDGGILAASTRGVDKTIEQGRGKKRGIVPGHAYTILQVYSPVLTAKSGIRLVQLRNPWGEFEWDGDWSDNSDLWNKHPNIRLEMRNFDTGTNAKDDGVFYMSWDDFLKNFDGIDVCFVNRDLGRVQLDVIEEYSVFGPFVGCIIGGYSLLYLYM